MDHRTIEKFGKSISRLGYGGMRFPKKEDGTVEMKAAVALLRRAYELGVNYFDTSFVYHNGESEKVFAEALTVFDRSTYYIADKMSIWACADEEDMKKRFYRQMETLKTDYIDFYLVHSLNRNHYAKVKELHCIEFLQEMKRQGKIKHLGFSFHDTLPVLQTILNEYDWEFGQLQINYLDWTNQHADQLYRELEQRGIPCIVMEPVRGGYLANLDEKRAAPFRAFHPEQTAASWAIRWAASLPNVMVVLSGMSDMEQLEDNVAVLSGFQPITPEEQAVIDQVVGEIRKVNDIPCTGCRYCMDCPMGVDIPELFTIYSKYKIFENPKGFVGDYKETVANKSSADLCIGCNSCANRCPQQIEIPEKLAMIHSLYLDQKAALENQA